MQHKDFGHFKRSAFSIDLERFKKWKEDSDSAVSKRFGLFELEQELADREIDKRIVTKIYKERQTGKEMYSHKQIKDARISVVTEKFRKIRTEKENPIKIEDKAMSQTISDKIAEENANFVVEKQQSPTMKNQHAILNSIINMGKSLRRGHRLLWKR